MFLELGNVLRKDMLGVFDSESIQLVNYFKRKLTNKQNKTKANRLFVPVISERLPKMSTNTSTARSPIA
jgi:hypothetical protein